MKILFVGDDWVGSNARSLAEGFRQAGHEVVVIDTTTVTLPDRWSAPWAYSKVAGHRSRGTVAAVHTRIDRVATMLRPDMLFVFKGIHLDQQRLLETPAALRVHYSPDDVSNPENLTPEYLAHEKLWDLVVTTKRHNVGELLDRGAQQVKYVHSAYDPAWHRPSARRGSRLFLVGFIGVERPDRSAAMVSLARAYGARMLVSGPGWRRNAALRATRAEIGDGAYGEQFSITVASIVANLVLLNSDNRDTHTCRSFEIPAAGGLFVGQRTDDHAELLDEGTECLLFSTAEELDDILEWCAGHPEEAARIAEAGYRRIASGRHRYVDRAREILDALG